MTSADLGRRRIIHKQRAGAAVASAVRRPASSRSTLTPAGSGNRLIAVPYGNLAAPLPGELESI